MKYIITTLITAFVLLGCNRDCVTKLPNKSGQKEINGLFDTNIEDAEMIFDLSVFVVYNRTKPGMTELSRDIERSIQEANSFSDRIQFRMTSSQYVKHNAILSNIRQSKKKEDDLCKANDKPGTINMYIVRSNSDLEGYTPVLQDGFEQYGTLDGLERVFVSYNGLADGAVLIHELGHFFGLGHTNDCRNYMSYNCYRDSFDAEQRTTILRFAQVYRKYLHRR